MKYTVQTSKGPVRFHSVGEPIVGIPAEGAAMTDKANGYIPESGVWTAREREFWINRTESETVKTAAKTIAALIAALEDVLADTEHQGSTRRDAYELLDAVK